MSRLKVNQGFKKKEVKKFTRNDKFFYKKSGVSLSIFKKDKGEMIWNLKMKKVKDVIKT